MSLVFTVVVPVAVVKGSYHVGEGASSLLYPPPPAFPYVNNLNGVTATISQYHWYVAGVPTVAGEIGGIYGVSST